MTLNFFWLWKDGVLFDTLAVNSTVHTVYLNKEEEEYAFLVGPSPTELSKQKRRMPTQASNPEP